MNELYLQGTALEADLAFVKMREDFRNDPRFEILDEPKKCLVHEMKYVKYRTEINGFLQEKWKEYGTHIGFDAHWIVVKCLENGNVYHINKATHYPFEGKWRVTPYIEDKGYEQQVTYPYEFKGNDALCKEETYMHGRIGAPRRKIYRLKASKKRQVTQAQ